MLTYEPQLELFGSLPLFVVLGAAAVRTVFAGQIRLVAKKHEPGSGFTAIFAFRDIMCTYFY